MLINIDTNLSKLCYIRKRETLRNFRQLEQNIILQSERKKNFVFKIYAIRNLTTKEFVVLESLMTISAD